MVGQQELRAAFARWEEYVEAAQQARNALRFFTHREIHKAFQRWWDFIENKREYEEMLSKAIRRSPTGRRRARSSAGSSFASRRRLRVAR